MWDTSIAVGFLGVGAGLIQEEHIIVAGVAAGAHYTHVGSGGNYLCLPKDPIYEKIIAGVQNPAVVYGAEYQMGAADSFGESPKHCLKTLL